MEEMPMGSFVYDAGAGEDPLLRMCMVYMFESSFITPCRKGQNLRDLW